MADIVAALTESHGNRQKGALHPSAYENHKGNDIWKGSYRLSKSLLGRDENRPSG